MLVRRQAVKALFAAALSWCFDPFLPSASVAASDPNARNHRMLVGLFADPRRAHSVGAAYAQTLPLVERTPDRLCEALLAGRLDLRQPIECLRSSISVQIRNDFEEGRVVCLDGWILAVTEARLCALAALTAE